MTAVAAPVVPWWGVGSSSAAPPSNPAQQALDALAAKNELALALLLLTSIQKEIAQMTTETDALKMQIAATSASVTKAVTAIQKLQAEHVDAAEVTAATAALKSATDTLDAAVLAIAAITPAPAP